MARRGTALITTYQLLRRTSLFGRFGAKNAGRLDRASNNATPANPIKIMVGSGSRGGMRTVIEAYERDGFLAAHGVHLVHSYREGSFLLRQLVLLQALAAYAWLLATKRVDLVHCHAAMWGSFWRKGLFASLARLLRIPVVLHLHGSEFKLFWARQPRWAQWLIRQHLEKATRVIVLSQSWEAFIRGIAPGADIIVVPNYVPVPPPGDAGEQHPHTILFLGLIGPRKGAFDLIRAFAMVCRDHPQARLIIGGNGQLAEARTLADQLGLGKQVIFPGWVEGEAKAALLRSAAIYVLPSYNEGLPMSVLEAMAAGLAVVTTRVGGLPELITDGVDGRLLEPGDLKGLSAALCDMLADCGRRSAMAEAGRRRVQLAYSDGAVLPILDQLYDGLRR
jgi:glycosyltransferase involved in cell wall biosynthesis